MWRPWAPAWPRAGVTCLKTPDPTAPLLAANIRWAAQRARTGARRSSASMGASVLWIGCSDAVDPAPEMLGLQPGEVLVHRSLANMAHGLDPGLLTTLAFAVDSLKVPSIVVCGHYGCRGVALALQAPGSDPADHWLAPLRALAAKLGRRDSGPADAEALARVLCERNVAAQVEALAASPIVRAAWARRQPLAVHGWIYSASDGLIRDLEVTTERTG